MNHDKHAENKCVGLEMKDKGLLVVVMTMSLIVKVMLNSTNVTVLLWEVGIPNEGVEKGGGDDGGGWFGDTEEFKEVLKYQGYGSLGWA